MKTIMKTGLGVLVLLAGVRLLAAQGVTSGQMTPSILNPGSTRSQTDLILRTWVVEGKVKTIQGDPVRGAKVVV